MRDLNTSTLIGRLTRDPEIRTVDVKGDQRSVCNFSIAVNRDEEVSFFNCVAWGKLAELINQYMAKGRQICVHGRLVQRQWEKEGQKRSSVELVVEQSQFIGSGKKENGQKTEAPKTDVREGQDEIPSDFDPGTDDDEDWD